MHLFFSFVLEMHKSYIFYIKKNHFGERESLMCLINIILTDPILLLDKSATITVTIMIFFFFLVEKGNPERDALDC